LVYGTAGGLVVGLARAEAITVGGDIPYDNYGTGDGLGTGVGDRGEATGERAAIEFGRGDISDAVHTDGRDTGRSGIAE
jgi:hypothetical protein